MVASVAVSNADNTEQYPLIFLSFSACEIHILNFFIIFSIYKPNTNS